MSIPTTRTTATTSRHSLSTLPRRQYSSSLDCLSTLPSNTASIVLTHSRRKKSSGPSLSPSQLARHSQGAINARGTLSRHMRVAGYVPLPHHGFRNDALVPLASTPTNPPSFAPIVVVHFDLSSVTTTPMWGYQRDLAYGLKMPEIVRRSLSPVDRLKHVGSPASCLPYGDTEGPHVSPPPPCARHPLELQAFLTAGIQSTFPVSLPTAGSSSQSVRGALPADTGEIAGIPARRHSKSRSPSLVYHTSSRKRLAASQTSAGQTKSSSSEPPLSLIEREKKPEKGGDWRQNQSQGQASEKAHLKLRRGKTHEDGPLKIASGTCPHPAPAHGKGKENESSSRNTSDCSTCKQSSHPYRSVPRKPKSCSPECSADAHGSRRRQRRPQQICGLSSNTVP